MDAVMSDAAVILSPLVFEWSVASRALAGQSISGDIHAVVPTADRVVFAVMDGLGHGSDAALAAKIAAETLKTFADEPVTDIVTHCHEAMRRTRGAAISIASFDAASGTMTWTGIGNVDGALFRSSPHARPTREALMLRGGIVGYSLPKPRTATLRAEPGDILIFATDGLTIKFRRETELNCTVQDLAANMLLRHGKATDDALILVARYLGNS
jgi:phosphoserine phosphatase RsbX